MKKRIWFCKIGECDDIPNGSDWPMREAVAQAYKKVTGESAKFIFSGWDRLPSEDYERGWHEGAKAGEDARYPRLEAEVKALKHDLERYVGISSEFATENTDLLAKLAEAKRLLEDELSLPLYDRDWKTVRQALAAMV